MYINFGRVRICNTHKSRYTSIAAENETCVYRIHRCDMIQIDVLHKTGFEYRRMRSAGTSSALTGNELETHLVSFETSLARNETRLSRRDLLLSGTVGSLV